MRRGSLPFWNRKTETRLIVGLGNPGKKYAGNRHNVGFMCLDYFAKEQNMSFTKGRDKAHVAEGRIAEHDVILAKPQSFMNLSGESVGRLVRKHKIKFENLIVVLDDLDLPVGRIRIRKGGSSGGHRGLNSIIQHISSREFVRIRVGIGRPKGGELSNDEDEVVSYVLGDFQSEEKDLIDKLIPSVNEALDCLLKEGLTATMNKFNGTDVRIG